MSTEQIYLQLIELTGLARENSNGIKRLETDVPNLYSLHTQLSKRVRDVESAQAKAYGRGLGRSSAWAAVSAIVAAVVAVGSMLISGCSAIMGT